MTTVRAVFCYFGNLKWCVRIASKRKTEERQGIHNLKSGRNPVISIHIKSQFGTVEVDSMQTTVCIERTLTNKLTMPVSLL